MDIEPDDARLHELEKEIDDPEFARACEHHGVRNVAKGEPLALFARSWNGGLAVCAKV